MRTIARLVAGSVPLLLFASCAIGYRGPPEHPRPACPCPAEVSARFDYDEQGTPPDFRLTVLEHTDGWDAFEVTGSVTLAGDAEPQRIEIEHYVSREAPPGRAPAVLITPILGGGNDLARLIAHHLADEGFHTTIVFRGVKVLTPEWDAAEVEHQIRRGIVARRRTIDWLSTRPEVDPARIGAFGISMGGIITAILAAVEPRVHSAVIAMAAGDLAAVVRASDEPRCHIYRSARMTKEMVTPDELERRLRTAIVSDPLLLAPFVDPRRVLLFTAERDTTVPTKQQHALRRALGDPPTYELPTGHYGAIFYTPFVKGRSSAWLKARLERPNPLLAR